jgi:hypothetical protein
VQACAESAFTGLEEARWRLSRGQGASASLEAARGALERFRKVQADQALLFALEAAVLRLEAGQALTGRRSQLLRKADDLWAQALSRNGHLRIHPGFAGLH